MSTKIRGALEERVRRMIHGRFPRGLGPRARTGLRKAAHADCEDAVATGFEKLVAKGRTMENPEGYVTTVAQNALRPRPGHSFLGLSFGVLFSWAPRSCGAWSAGTAPRARLRR